MRCASPSTPASLRMMSWMVLMVVPMDIGFVRPRTLRRLVELVFELADGASGTASLPPNCCDELHGRAELVQAAGP